MGLDRKGKLIDRLESCKAIVSLMRDLEISSDEVNAKIVQMIGEINIELKELEVEEEIKEKEAISKCIQLIDRKYLDKELGKNESYKLLQEIRCIFGRKNISYSNHGLKGWVDYLKSYVCEYGDKKDKEGWVTMKISKLRIGDEEDDEAI